MIFADTSYFVALLNPGDKLHRRAVEFAGQGGRIVTTQWVLAELLAYYAASRRRQAACLLAEDLANDPAVRIVSADAASFQAGLALYRDRPDKHWSLIDCISFAIMRERRLAAALTGDHHFEQAGFRALLRG